MKKKSNTSEFVFQVSITINRHNNNSSTVVDSFVEIALFKSDERAIMYGVVRIAENIVDYIPIRQIMPVSNLNKFRIFDAHTHKKPAQRE